MRRFILALALGVLLVSPAVTALAQETIIVDGFPTRRVAYGDAYNAALTVDDSQGLDGRRIGFWTFTGDADDCVVIRMRSSAFAPYLRLVRDSPNGPAVKEEGSRGAEASMRVALPRTGTYFITATSSGRGQALGDYTLSLDRCGS
jgi:hypothetical protein